jgi:DNA-binding NarL/FixJ family response regulator
MMNTIQIYIVSQQPFFRDGLYQSLAAESDIDVLGSSEAGAVSFDTLDKQTPNVFIIDLDGAPEDNLKLAHRLKRRIPSAAVVTLTSNTGDEELFRAIKVQASAYAGKEIGAEQLVELIHQVARGLYPINEYLTTRPAIAEQVLSEFHEYYSLHGDIRELISPLTSRETEILQYIAQGLLNKQIAIAIGISEQTIKNHVTSILRKLNANVRTEAVVLALKHGLIALD